MIATQYWLNQTKLHDVINLQNHLHKIPHPPPTHTHEHQHMFTRKVHYLCIILWDMIKMCILFIFMTELPIHNSLHWLFFINIMRSLCTKKLLCLLFELEMWKSLLSPEVLIHCYQGIALNLKPDWNCPLHYYEQSAMCTISDNGYKYIHCA